MLAYLTWAAVILVGTLFTPAYAAVTPEVDPSMLIGIGTAVGAVIAGRNVYLSKLNRKK